MHRLINKSKQVLEKKFIRYLIIGGLSFVIDFSLFNLFVFLFDIQPLPANMTSIVISMFFNFLMSNYWTFKAGGKGKSKKIVKYLTITSFNYIVNNATLYFLISRIYLHPSIAKFIVTGLQVTWTFIIYKIWVFKTEDADLPPTL